MKSASLSFLLSMSLLFGSSGKVFPQQRWTPLGGGIRGAPLASSWVFTLLVHQDELYVGGFFAMAGDISASSMAKWDGSSWSPVGSGLTGSHVFENEVQCLASYNGDLYVGGRFDSIGGIASRGIAKWDGSHWSSVGGGLTRAGTVSAMAVYNNELYVSGGFDSIGGIFARSIAKWNGVNWSRVGPESVSVGGKMIVHNNQLYVGGVMGNLSRVVSWDGSKWSDASSGLEGTSFIVNSFASYQGKLYMAAGGAYLPDFIKVLDISSWSTVAGPKIHVFPYTALVEFHNELYAGGTFDSAEGINPPNGIAKSNNLEQWSSVDGGTIRGVIALAVYNNELYAGGSFSIASGDSAYNIAKLTTPTDVREYHSGIPNRFVLSQNYPNPFNPSTVIHYQLPVASRVTLRVFDMLGQEVSTLANETQDAGYKSVEWNSTNNSSSSIASGVYFYRIDAMSVAGSKQSFTQVKKMVLVK